MTLSARSRLGPYEILAPLGAGGMGEVYRARDTRLKREVAIKVLPETFAQDSERLARFQREAELLATLNHPNIAQIYGLEIGPAEAGPHMTALVMELVEGPTLAELLARSEDRPLRPSGVGAAPSGRPMPIDEAVPIAKQIAEALEAAHEQGIIHRDLKPANIKVRPDGTVKVLDFGLAKAMEPTGVASPSVSQSPTITTPAMTQAGMILGTAAYMSPEQARGRPVDKRADIWAFGCVLYEMLTGNRAFAGDDVSEVVASVLAREPDWTRLPPTLSPALGTYLRRCLHKNPKERIADAQNIRLALEGAFETAVPRTAAPTVVAQWRRVALVGVAATVASGAIIGTLVWLAMRPAEPVSPRVSRLSVAPSGTAALTISGVDRDLAITPDGSRFVYVGNNGTQLFVRALDALEPVAIASGQLRGPFVSPDGQWVGFIDNARTLKRVAISGGPAIPIAPLDGLLRGATWLPDDTIVFATTNATGLQRVAAGSGTPTDLTRPDRTRGEDDHLWPEAVPGGGAVLFTITAQAGGLDATSIAVLDLRTNTPTILVRGGSHAHYVAGGRGSPARAARDDGYLVYAAGATLRAVPFDLGRLVVRGPAVPVVPRLLTTTVGAGDFGVATDGTLVYVDAPGGAAAATARTLVWVDRTGKEEPIAAPPRGYEHPRLSPDGTRLALYIADQEGDIWVWDLRRTTLTRLTFDPGQDYFPIWTPDGRRIVFASPRVGGTSNVWWQAADGTGTAERLTTSASVQVPTGLSPDGMQVVFHEVTPMMGRDLLRLTLDGTKQITSLLQTPFNERNGVVSNDARWLAYESDSSGRSEIYVRPFPNAAAGQWQVSTAGGTRPLWARGGTELFFLGTDGALMRVPVEVTAAKWNAGAPTKLLEPGYYTGGDAGRTYDVSLNGQRFLMIKAPGRDSTAPPPSVIVVQHWVEELKRLVPTK